MSDTSPLRSELEQQLALAYALRDNTASLGDSFDPDAVLKQILINIGWVVPHDAAVVILIEHDLAHIACETGYRERGWGDWTKSIRVPVTQVASFQHMVETGRPVHVADASANPLWTAASTIPWQRSYAAAPIRLRDQTIGFLILDSETPDFFTALHLDTLQAFANQVAVVIHSARLLKETQQRLVAQTALLNASSAISSTLDLPTVVERCAAQLCHAIDATSAYICYWNQENDTTLVVAEYYGPHASVQERVPDPDAGKPDTTDETTWLMHKQALVRHIDDPAMPDSTRQHMRQFGVKSILSIPLLAKNQTFGYAALWETRHRREFTAEEIQLCLGIAQQTAIAFDNAQLFETARRQLALARMLQAVGALLTAEMSLSDVFERIFDLLSEVIRSDCVALELLDEHQQVYLAAQRGFPDPDLARRTTRKITGPIMRERWGTHSVIVLPDTSQDSRWLDIPEFNFIRSAILVWLRVKQRMFGMLMVYSRTVNAYNESSSETVTAFANQAAIAIENAQLSEAIRQYAAQLQLRVNERTAELEQERHRTQAILDAAGEGIIFTDTQGIIEYMNPQMERLTGYSASEVVGQTPGLWRSGLTPPAVYENLWNTIRRGEVWQGEMINRHQLGRLYDTALTVAPLLDADQSIVGYVGIQRDISHQKELDRLKDQFVSSVSHEFRTPLANIKLYLRLLDSGRPEKREQYMQTLQRETARLENLIEDLLSLSRLDLDAMLTRNRPTDLHPLIAEIIADRSDLAARHGITLDYLPKADLPLALAEAGMFAQVITNLLSNAINYTPPGGLVTISTDLRTANRQEWITVSVQDTGPGIAPADRPHIFKRFYRGEAARQSNAPGTGLGLAICQQVVEKMEGQLTVESEPGEGAAFTIWLRPAAGGAGAHGLQRPEPDRE
ncbi:two-component system, OmpR family, sensor histidine kinase KdpD [Thermoflexales bacterium]|nr:two-component system, OmpR family, sensor histidine kinase KdpD [Thermoflexales bacterium]